LSFSGLWNEGIRVFHSSFVQEIFWDEVADSILDRFNGVYILGLYTLQQTGNFNVFNFFSVAITILSIFMAYTLSELTIRFRKMGWVIVIFIGVFTLPRIAYETVTMAERYFENKDSVIVTPGALEAFDFIRLHTDEHVVIQSSPSNILDTKSSYLAAMTGRSSYIAGTYLLETHNQPFKERVANEQALFGASFIFSI